MADQVDSMSDAELRTKLAEHGFPIMPVTASTRQLLVKKLKLVLEGKSKPRTSVDAKVENRRSLARYSSGEESDLDSNNAQNKRGRRATTGGAMLPPAVSKTRRTPVKKDSPVKRGSDKGSESDEEKSPLKSREEIETVTTRRVTRTYAVNDQDDCETGSDSDVDVDKKVSPPYRSNSRASDHISSSFASEINTNPPKLTLFSRPSIQPTISSSDQLNSIRSRLGLSTTFDRPSSSFSSTLDRPATSYTSTLDRPATSYTSTFASRNYQPTVSSVDEVESPYLSNFTRRLSSLKPDPPRPVTSFLDKDVTNGATVQTRRSYITGASRSEFVDYKTASEKKFLKNNLVSLALVGLVALFFFCLFFMYMVKKNDITSVVDDQNSIIPICQLNIPGNRPGINCVPKEQVTYAKELMKVIHQELIARTAAYKCNQPGALPYLTEREIIDIASAKAASSDVSQCRTDLNNLEVLLINNPRWGLNVVQLKSQYTKEADYSVIQATDAIVLQRTRGTVALAFSDPSTPLTCLFVNTLYSAGASILVIGVLTLLALGLQRFYKYYMNYKKRQNDDIYSMVTQIIDIISQEADDSGEECIPMNHVRDTLISPQNREKMAWVWDAAVKFIELNESRVRTEIQTVDGEDCKIWRWTSSAAGSPKRSAAWQGQAFETQEGSVNNITVSPTPCLKIRHMFDKNDTNPNLQNVVQDAILEKCEERCNILHIDIERNTCCVYVKCASQADAGIVYRSLHGWWYEGRLITVKYLHLQRYMQRFPNSPSVGPFLKPSHQKRSWNEE